MAAIGCTTNAEQAALRSFMLKTAAGTMLTANVGTAELVTLGGRVMTQEFAETIIQTYNKIGSNMPLADFVETLENSVMPATVFLDKTFEKVAETCSHNPDGIQRLIERGFTAEELIAILKSPTFIKIQTDGSKAFIRLAENRYSIIIINETSHKLITCLRNIDYKALVNLGGNYGWN